MNKGREECTRSSLRKRKNITTFEKENTAQDRPVLLNLRDLISTHTVHYVDMVHEVVKIVRSSTGHASFDRKNELVSADYERLE